MRAEELIDYRESVKQAEKVLSGDTATMLDVLKELNPFASVATIGENLR